MARGNGYITLPTAKNYTIECDVSGTEVFRKNENGETIREMPEIGVVNTACCLAKS